MGCGGSRADAIEPRYYESWTRETESTWLTYTDSDALPSVAAADSGPEAGGLHAGDSLSQGIKWGCVDTEEDALLRSGASPWASTSEDGDRDFPVVWKGQILF
ncbi:brain and acute leukemia cytoplasmic protein isoform X2 [Onychomys torridus]|uniref:brain and acute leukemia cytoplasmic protein isoform X2 n=1 Tax=Onychomys torridus TaxID=38674 RepID=UPI00167F99CB|nr:brain and acute leukemia cytoplasmic protein isoform X2 [Onychomys torridus]